MTARPLAWALALLTALAEWCHGIGSEEFFEECAPCEQLRRLRGARDVVAGDEAAIQRRELGRLLVGRWHREQLPGGSP